MRKSPSSRYANGPTPLGKRSCFPNGVSRNYPGNARKAQKQHEKYRNSWATGAMGKTKATWADAELCRNFGGIPAKHGLFSDGVGSFAYWELRI